MRFPVLPIVILFLPLAEIAGFIVVGQRIGALATIGLVVLAAFIGIVLIRLQGLSALARINLAINRGERPGQAIVDSFMILLAGLLLILPGFITDAIGLLLFIPVVRRFIWKIAGRRLATGIRFSHFEMKSGGYSPSADDIVDLESKEFRRSSEVYDGIIRHTRKDPSQGL